MAERLSWLGFRLLGVALFVGAVALIWVERAWFDPYAIQALLADNPWAPLAFVAAHVIVSLTFVIPRTILSFVAGLVFGLWWGIVLSSIGGVLGATAGFLIARHLHDRFPFIDRLPRLGAVVDRIERGGWRAVALIRLLPVMPHSPVNYAFGLTKVPLGAYALGSLVGLLPQTILFVDLGATGQAIGTGRSWLWPSLIAIVAVAASWVLPKLLRRDRVGE